MEGEFYAEKDSDGIVTFTLNRTGGRNSFSRAFLQQFVDATAQYHDDKDVRALVLRSTVPKVFCAGADLKERAGMSEVDVELFVASLRDGVDAFARLPFPTIAAIEGAALGGGLELALAADLRVCSRSSLLGLPETALAIIPGAGGTQRLPRVVGLAKAKEMTFLAQRLSGEDAASAGLVTECVNDGQTEARAREMALTIAKKAGPVAIRQAKAALTHGMEATDMAAALQIERECYGNVICTTDRVEGLAAFKEKRAPQYRGE
jgi:methylglutaconyl-CoA hydratase